jgi:hypothetical protein
VRACGGGDAEGGEVGGHLGVFDPVGCVGEVFEVEGETGWGVGVSARYIPCFAGGWREMGEGEDGSRRYFVVFW